MTQSLQRWRGLASRGEPPAGDVGRALRELSAADLLRLRSLARLYVTGLPTDVTWSDLLQEAIARSLDGSRHWPPHLPLLTFLAGVMRSLRAAHWQRARRERDVLPLDDATAARVGDLSPSNNPERVYASVHALAAIDRLFAADMVALKIVAGLTSGLTADEIRRHYGLTEIEYDTARRRMRRTLLRHGLAWSQR
jgi:RNA polymerase sigma-70 factor (ECF subfamily)